MVLWFSVPLSEAVTDNRWAAEFHRPGYKFVPKDARNWRKIGRCSRLCQYGLSIKMNDMGNGVPIYRLNEIEDCFLTEVPSKFAPISATVADDYQLQKNDILFCRTNGNINFVGRTGLYVGDKQAVFASYLVRVRTDSEKLLPEYLTIFLNTRFGRRQILRRAMPSNQVNVSAAELKRIDAFLAPTDFQQSIAEVVQSAYEYRKLGIQSYGEAKQLLESELGLDKLRFQKPVSYTTTFSDLEISRRFDSEHFYPAFQHFVGRLKRSVKLTRLSECLTSCQRGKQPHYRKDGLPVINSKHVQPNRVILSGNRFADSGRNSDSEIRFGDLLLNGTGRGTLGRAAPYLEAHHALPDNHVTIFRTQEMDPVFLSYYLNSAAGQMQVEMHQRGSSGQLELYPFDIRRLLVWDAPKAFQERIRELHDKAAFADRESKRLLELAKTRVEQLIEDAIES